MRFIKTIQRAGLYAHLRIGPYVCAEWNFGSFSVSSLYKFYEYFGSVSLFHLILFSFFVILGAEDFLFG